jgi:hypothetical protein
MDIVIACYGTDHIELLMKMCQYWHSYVYFSSVLFLLLTN